MEDNGHPDQSIWGESSLHQTRGAPTGAGVGPGAAGTGPVELGRSEDTVTAVAVLPDGRVITGGYDVFGVVGGGGRMLVWDPAQPGTGPVEVGRDQGTVTAVAVLPDGRVITGGLKSGVSGRVGKRRRAGAGVGPGAAGYRPGRGRPRTRRRWLPRLAVPPDGRVITGGNGRRRAGAGGTRRSRAPARSSWPRPGRGDRGGGAAGRPGGHRQRLCLGAAAEYAERLTRHSARMLCVRARYFSLPI